MKRTTRPGEQKLRRSTGPKSRLTPQALRIIKELIGNLGATQQVIADYFGIPVKNVEYWNSTQPEFRRVCKMARVEYGLKVGKALSKLATGFHVRDTKFFMNKYGRIIPVETLKYYPPDFKAANKWLTIMFRDIWAEVPTVNHKVSGMIEHRHVDDIPVEELTPEEREMLFNLNMKQLTSAQNN